MNNDNIVPVEDHGYDYVVLENYSPARIDKIHKYHVYYERGLGGTTMRMSFVSNTEMRKFVAALGGMTDLRCFHVRDANDDTLVIRW